MEFDQEIPTVCCMLRKSQISLADLEHCCLGLRRRRVHGAAPRLNVMVILQPAWPSPRILLCCQM